MESSIDISSFKHSRERPKKFKKKPNPEARYLLKHCFLHITPIVGSELSEAYVPFIAFMQLAKAGNVDLNIQTTKLSALEEFLIQAG